MKAEPTCMCLQPAERIRMFEGLFRGDAPWRIDVDRSPGVMFAIAWRCTQGKNRFNRHATVKFYADDVDLTLNAAECGDYFHHDFIPPSRLFQSVPSLGSLRNQKIFLSLGIDFGNEKFLRFLMELQSFSCNEIEGNS